jgi:acrylyl-CoA reductase (NADPH)
MPQRLAAWSRLARDLDRAQLAAMTTHAPFARAMDVAHEIVQGKVRGRTVVDIG